MFVKDEGYFKAHALKPRIVMEVLDLNDIIPIAPFVNALSDYWHFIDSTYLPPVIWLCGLNRSVIDAWCQKWVGNFPHGIENDFAEFESRMSVELLELEFATYDTLGGKHLRPYFEMQKKMDLRGDGYRYRRAGGRMSGVPNTSLGNTIVNVTTHLSVLADFTPGQDFVMVVNGDDNYIWCNRTVYEFCVEHMAARFSNFGMKAEIVAHEEASKGSFCSSSFGRTPSGSWVLAPHPFRAMCKSGKFPETGAAGPSTVIDLFKDYSSTPHFWPLHLFVRRWLTHMGIEFNVAPSVEYDSVSVTLFLNFLDLNPIASDGTWIIKDISLVRHCLELEGLLEPLRTVPKDRNYDKPLLLYGLPPQWGRPAWVRLADNIRQKLLNFWRSSDYSKWSGRLELGSGDALLN